MKMGLGNRIGVRLGGERRVEGAVRAAATARSCWKWRASIPKSRSFSAVCLGETTVQPEIARGGESVSIDELLDVYEGRLEDVYPCNIRHTPRELPNIRYRARTPGRSPACAPRSPAC